MLYPRLNVSYGSAVMRVSQCELFLQREASLILTLALRATITRKPLITY
ncbi:hypothetical protein CFP56_029929 [Quercus suber]|uniref:Uncharacterized protein n=1 Tax=Quercus suber TaxID=58331 RepID=A0AAW0JPY4_QUESU